MSLTTNEQTLYELLISIQDERSLTDSEKTLLDNLEKKLNRPEEPTKTNSKWTPLTYAEMLQLQEEGELYFIKAYNEFVKNMNEQDNDEEHNFKFINYATNLILADAVLAKKAIENLKAKTIDNKPHLYALLVKIQKEYFDEGVKGNINAKTLYAFKEVLIDSLPKGSSNEKLLEDLSTNYKVGATISEQNYTLYNHLMDNIVKSNFHSIVATCKLNVCTIITWLDAIECMIEMDLEVSSSMFDILTTNYYIPIYDISKLLMQIDLIPIKEKIEIKHLNLVLDLIKKIFH